MYEITFITKEEKDPSVKKTIEQLEGKVVSNFSLGRRKLAYPIKKELAGYYSGYLFDFNKEKMADLDNKLRLEPGIIRFLIVSRVLPKAVPQKPRKEKIERTIPAPISRPQLPSPEEIAKEPLLPQSMRASADKIITKEQKETVISPKPPAKIKREVEATKEDRLKALEDKLSELLEE